MNPQCYPLCSVVLDSFDPVTLTIWPWTFLCSLPGPTAVTCSSAFANLLSLVSKRSKMQPWVVNWYKQTGTHSTISRFPFNYFYSLISLVPPPELLSKAWSSSLHRLIYTHLFFLSFDTYSSVFQGAGVSKKGPGAFMGSPYGSTNAQGFLSGYSGFPPQYKEIHLGERWTSLDNAQ